MGQYFVDTSALVKRYRAEDGTDRIDALFADSSSAFLISPLGLVEAISAFALQVRAGHLQHSDYIVARKKLLGDIADGTVKAVRLLAAHYRHAERLLDRHAPSHRFRTLDALQLSVALDLRQGGRVGAFVCADHSLCEIAALERLDVINPLLGP